MNERYVIIDKESKNVNIRFHKAIYRTYRVDKIYKTAREASKFHKLNKCDYRFIYCDNSGNEHVIKEVMNAK